MGYSARRGFTNGKVSGAQRQAEIQQKITQMQEQKLGRGVLFDKLSTDGDSEDSVHVHS